MNFFIKKRENPGIKHLNDPNAFIECSNTMDNVYENIDDYNPYRQRKNFIRCRKLNISLVFVTQSYLYVSKDVRLNSTHYLILKINNNQRELQNIAINHSADIDYQDFVKIYREYTKQPYSFFDNRYNITSKWSSKI